MNSIVPKREPNVVLSGYRIDTLIFDGPSTRIYRARRESDGLPVMLKSANDELAIPDGGVGLRHEYEIARRFSVPSVIQVYGLENYRNTPVIVMEDFGGDSLDNLNRQYPFSLEEILQIAISIAQGLSEIHAKNVIHKDLTPANLVFNAETQVVKIIDFGISTYLTREQAAIANPKIVESSLPYLSPEQTGRMNRSIDYRTDYYAFGATLYELLTGSKLFDVSEPMEWFHCHIAKQAVPVSERNPKVPKVVSDIVMKLLEKMAEDRYQSACGIQADLQRCLNELKRSGKIDPFVIAQQDIPNHFHIPQRLYGREKEVAQLLQSFERTSQGSNELVLVSGYSGVGKSCLIKEVYKPITQRRGHFVSGKFDQLHRNVPYSALILALQDLVKQLLTETDEQLSEWKNKILEVLGTNAQLITNLIQELELIIGAQPDVPKLPPLESEQRFHRVLLHFIRLFAEPLHPLVIFIDDLQWADTSSLKIIELLIDPQYAASHLMVIGSYRDNEVLASPALTAMLYEIQSKQASISEIVLGPLSREHLTELIVDTLHASKSDVAELAEIVSQKTAGNPFFTEEFLKFLYKENLIFFDLKLGKWNWDLPGIRQQNTTDNVVELMSGKLNRLPNETLELLKIAACIGNRFSLKVLAVVSSLEPNKIVEDLRPAISDGIVAPLGDAYQLVELELNVQINTNVDFAFAHDRVQQAAYSLLDTGGRSQAHLNIGQLLLGSFSGSELSEHLFEVVNHLNLGMDLINQSDDKNQLCRLNIEAGKKAKSATAYEAALNYFNAALGLLPDQNWLSKYNELIDLHIEAAEAAALNHDYEQMESLLLAGFNNVNNAVDEARLGLVEVAALQAQGKLRETVDRGRELLIKLGHFYPKQIKQYHVVLGLIKVARRLRKVDVASLKSLPLMSDSSHLIANAIGVQIGRAAMFVEPKMLALMVYKSILTQLKFGHSPYGVTAWGVYGMILAANLGKPERGFEFAKLAIELAEKHNFKYKIPMARHVFNAMTRHWLEPLSSTLDPLHNVFRTALENGDFEYATLAITVRQMNALHAGQELNSFMSDTLLYQETVRPLKQGNTADYLDVYLQFGECLSGLAVNAFELKGSYYNISEKQKQQAADGDHSFMVINAEMCSWLYYLFGENSKALAIVDQMRTDAAGHGGFYRGATSVTLESLVILASIKDLKKNQQRPLLRRLKRNQKRLSAWSRHCPENFQNKYLLVEAVRLCSIGKEFAAHDLFEQSMAIAEQQGFVLEQAVAAELCAQMHWQAGRKTLAEPYLKKSRNLYLGWGAQAKVDQLENQYPQLARAVGKQVGTTTSAIMNFDITALTKALKAIADEKSHSQMIQAIIEAAVEFAGAENGVLILRDADGQLCIEGEFALQDRSSKVMCSRAIDTEYLPVSLINYVIRTHSSVVVHDAQLPFKDIVGLEKDPYIQKRKVRSILCLPIISGSSDQHEIIGLIYLENNLVSGTFTQERFDILEIIGMAAAGRLELSRKAAIDGLTGLFNYEYFHNMLTQEILAASRYKRDLALLLIDIDHFKKFNDTWGHQIGDLVLKEVAQTIKMTCRTSDVVARYGGEEMVVILPSTNKQAAIEIAERVRENVESLVVTAQGQKLNVTISLGLTLMEYKQEEKESIIQRADEALYRSKHGGRNQLSVIST